MLTAKSTNSGHFSSKSAVLSTSSSITLMYLFLSDSFVSFMSNVIMVCFNVDFVVSDTCSHLSLLSTFIIFLRSTNASSFVVVGVVGRDVKLRRSKHVSPIDFSRKDEMYCSDCARKEASALL